MEGGNNYNNSNVGGQGQPHPQQQQLSSPPASNNRQQQAQQPSLSRGSGATPPKAVGARAGGAMSMNIHQNEPNNSRFGMPPQVSPQNHGQGLHGDWHHGDSGGQSYGQQYPYQHPYYYYPYPQEQQHQQQGIPVNGGGGGAGWPYAMPPPHPNPIVNHGPPPDMAPYPVPHLWHPSNVPHPGHPPNAMANFRGTPPNAETQGQVTQKESDDAPADPVHPVEMTITPKQYQDLQDELQDLKEELQYYKDGESRESITQEYLQCQTDLREAYAKIHQRDATIARLIEKHAAAINNLNDKHAATMEDVIKNLKDEHAAAMEEAVKNLKEKHTATISQLTKHHSSALHAMKEGNDDLIAERDNALQDKEALETARDTALREQAEAHTKTIQSIEQAHKEAIRLKERELTDAHVVSLREKDEAHTSVIQQKDEAHTKAIQTMEQKLAEVLQSLQQEHTQAIQSKQRDHEAAILEKNEEIMELQLKGLSINPSDQNSTDAASEYNGISQQTTQSSEDNADRGASEGFVTLGAPGTEYLRLSSKPPYQAAAARFATLSSERMSCDQVAMHIRVMFLLRLFQEILLKFSSEEFRQKLLSRAQTMCDAISAQLVDNSIESSPDEIASIQLRLAIQILDTERARLDEEDAAVAQLMNAREKFFGLVVSSILAFYTHCKDDKEYAIVQKHYDALEVEAGKSGKSAEAIGASKRDDLLKELEPFLTPAKTRDLQIRYLEAVISHLIGYVGAESVQEHAKESWTRYYDHVKKLRSFNGSDFQLLETNFIEPMKTDLDRALQQQQPDTITQTPAETIGVDFFKKYFMEIVRFIARNFVDSHYSEDIAAGLYAIVEHHLNTLPEESNEALADFVAANLPSIEKSVNDFMADKTTLALAFERQQDLLALKSVIYLEILQNLLDPETMDTLEREVVDCESAERLRSDSNWSKSIINGGGHGGWQPNNNYQGLQEKDEVIARLNARLQAQETEHAEAIDRLKKSHASDLETKEEAIRRLKKSHTEELDEAVGRLKESIKSLKKDHEEELQSATNRLKRNHAEELETKDRDLRKKDAEYADALQGKQTYENSFSIADAQCEFALYAFSEILGHLVSSKIVLTQDARSALSEVFDQYLQSIRVEEGKTTEEIAQRYISERIQLPGGESPESFIAAMRRVLSPDQVQATSESVSAALSGTTRRRQGARNGPRRSKEASSASTTSGNRLDRPSGSRTSKQGRGQFRQSMEVSGGEGSSSDFSDVQSAKGRESVATFGRRPRNHVDESFDNDNNDYDSSDDEERKDRPSREDSLRSDESFDDDSSEDEEPKDRHSRPRKHAPKGKTDGGSRRSNFNLDGNGKESNGDNEEAGCRNQSDAESESGDDDGLDLDPSTKNHATFLKSLFAYASRSGALYESLQFVEISLVEGETLSCVQITDATRFTTFCNNRDDGPCDRTYKSYTRVFCHVGFQSLKAHGHNYTWYHPLFAKGKPEMVAKICSATKDQYQSAFKSKYRLSEK